ncbi:MAG: flagellar protein FliS [Lachnospiraceae bacterium]|nr:flagellar protein FliS [Lachnospiraceae bacterium]
MTQEERSGFSYRIMQANPTELIVILFEMAECYIAQAEEDYKNLVGMEGFSSYQEQVKERMDCYEKAEIREAINDFRHSIDLAENVLHELNHSLDLKYSLSVNLMQIYLAILNNLRAASNQISGELLSRDRKMLARLRGAFAAIAKEDQRGPVMRNTQTVYAGLTYGRGTLNETLDHDINRGFCV